MIPKTRTYLLKRWISPLLAVWLLLCLTAAPALAHANLLQASPGNGDITADSPARIALKFSEPLEPDLVDLILYDANGKKIPLDPPRLTKGDASEMYVEPPPLDDGSYTVAYTVVSEDGHPVTERYAFAVGQPTPGFKLGAGTAMPDMPLSEILLLASRYLAEGMLLLGGGLYAVGLLARRSEYPSMSELLGRAQPLLWGVLLAATVAEWLAYSAGLPTSLFRFLLAGDWAALFESSFARMVSVQLLLLLLLALPGMISGWQALIWTLLVSNLAFGGHAFGIEPVWLALTLRVLHLLTAALWIGGALYLLLAIFRRKSVHTASVHQGAFRKVFLRVLLIASLATVVTGVLMVGVQSDWVLLLPSTMLWRDLLVIKLFLTFDLLLIGYVQTKRWRQNYQSLSHPLLRGELALFAIVTLLAVWLSQIEYPLP